MQNGRRPSATSWSDARRVLEFIAQFNSTATPLCDSLNEKLLLQIARASNAQISPMASIIGGIAAQEILKVPPISICSALYPDWCCDYSMLFVGVFGQVHSFAAASIL